MPSVTDPVCHMQINSEDAVAKTEHQGQTYYFCADRCRSSLNRTRAAMSAARRRALDDVKLVDPLLNTASRRLNG
jgi:YHS domain-containing protein